MKVHSYAGNMNLNRKCEKKVYMFFFEKQNSEKNLITIVLGNLAGIMV